MDSGRKLTALTTQELSEAYTDFVYTVVKQENSNAKPSELKAAGRSLREEFRRRSCFPILTRLPESLDEIICLKIFPKYYHDDLKLTVNSIGKFIAGEALYFWISHIDDYMTYKVLDNLAKHLTAIATLYGCYGSAFNICEEIRKTDAPRYKHLEYEERESRITQHVSTEVSKRMGISYKLAVMLVNDCWIYRYKMIGSSLLLNECSEKSGSDLLKEGERFERMNFGEFASVLAEFIRENFTPHFNGDTSVPFESESSAGGILHEV